jgi:hypothetical protein
MLPGLPSTLRSKPHTMGKALLKVREPINFISKKNLNDDVGEGRQISREHKKRLLIF